MLSVPKDLKEGVVQGIICGDALHRVYLRAFLEEIGEKRQILSIGLLNTERLPQPVKNRTSRYLWNGNGLDGERAL